MNTAALFRTCVGLLAVSAFNGSMRAQQKNSAHPRLHRNIAPAQQKTTPRSRAAKETSQSPRSAVLLGQLVSGARTGDTRRQENLFRAFQADIGQQEPSGRTCERRASPQRGLGESEERGVGDRRLPAEGGHDATAATVLRLTPCIPRMMGSGEERGRRTADD